MPQLRRLEDLEHHLKPSEKMPLVFLGHGSPMNAIEDTEFSQSWRILGKTLPRPRAILVISAHWMTRGVTLVDISDAPRTIHDFYGFPQELYAQNYPAKGNPQLAREVVSLLKSHNSAEDDRWGLDHGAWTILKYLYPEADVPVFQISIDMSKGLDHQLEIGKALQRLRQNGVLILGSGNIVHNLGEIQWDENAKAHDYAFEFDKLFTDYLTDRDFRALADRQGLGSILHRAHPTVDHYMPALTIAGAAQNDDELSFLSESIIMGSISMKSFVFY